VSQDLTGKAVTNKGVTPKAQNRKPYVNKQKRKVMKNMLTKKDYSFYYEASVWDQYEDFVYAVQRGKVDKAIIIAKQEQISMDEMIRPSGDTVMHVSAEYGNEQLFNHFLK